MGTGEEEEEEGRDLQFNTSTSAYFYMRCVLEGGGKRLSSSFSSSPPPSSIQSSSGVRFQSTGGNHRQHQRGCRPLLSRSTYPSSSMQSSGKT